MNTPGSSTQSCRGGIGAWCRAHRSVLLLLLLLVFLYALDQCTKWYIVTHFRMPVMVFQDGVSVFKTDWLSLNIIRIHNTGVAFGFGNGTAWAPFVFLGVQVVALVGLVWLFVRGFFCTRLLRLAWVFVMAGVLGNMTDRLLQGFFLPGAERFSFWDCLCSGYVVDFIDFSFPWIVGERFPQGYHWAAFNVADACVCTAAGLFIISSFFFPAPQPPAKSDTPAA